MMVNGNEIKGLIFDKDGTLFDFAATWEAWAQAFLIRLCAGDRGHAQQMGKRIGFDLEAAKFDRDSIVIAGMPSEVAQALMPAFPTRSLDDVLTILNEEAEKAPQAEAVPLSDLLTNLQGKGLKLGVATNDSETPAMAHLRAAGVTGFFDFIAGSDSGHGGKPAPGQLLAFCAATGLDPAHCAMIGDSTHDLRAGRAAGMRCVGVLTGLATEDELHAFADVILPDIGHLPAWLDAQATAT